MLAKLVSTQIFCYSEMYRISHHFSISEMLTHNCLGGKRSVHFRISGILRYCLDCSRDNQSLAAFPPISYCLRVYFHTLPNMRQVLLLCISSHYNCEEKTNKQTQTSACKLIITALFIQPGGLRSHQWENKCIIIAIRIYYSFHK